MTDELQTRNYTKRERGRKDANKKETKIFELSIFFLSVFMWQRAFFLFLKKTSSGAGKMAPWAKPYHKDLWPGFDPRNPGDRDRIDSWTMSSDLHMHTALRMAMYWISVLTAALGTDSFEMSSELCGSFSAPLRSSSQNKECSGPEVHIHPKHIPHLILASSRYLAADGNWLSSKICTASCTYPPQSHFWIFLREVYGGVGVQG